MSSEEQNLILKLNTWRIVSDSVAAFSIAKRTSGIYELTVILKTGYEIVEEVSREDAIEFGNKYIERMNEVYGLKMATYKEKDDGTSKSNKRRV